jgi:hypothetical protein
MKKIIFLLSCSVLIASCDILSSDSNGSSGTTSGVCQTGGWSQSGLIQPCASCPSNSTPTTNGTFCTCTDTTQYFNSTSNSCETNSCTGVYWPYNGTCTPCPSGSTINSTNTGCTCQSGTFSYTLNQCVNSPNCSGNQWDDNGSCTPCPSGSTAYKDNSSCLCATGTFNESSNTCVVGSGS